VSYGKMSRAYPVAGSAYTYTRRSISSHLGFLVGWATLLDYFFIPMVIWLIGAAFLSAAFPAIPTWLWISSFIAITSALNVLGIKVCANVNSALMVFQLLVLGIFVVLSLRYVAVGGAPLFSAAPWFNSATTFSGIAAGAALAAYAFLGFDAVTTLTEETVAPARSIPRAIMFVVLVGGGLFILTAYTTQLVHPGFVFGNVDAAALDIAKTIGQQLFASIFLAGMIVAQFTAGISAQAAASRLLFAMGRDGVLPRRLFGYLHPRLQTPIFNILLSGAVGFIALKLTVSTSTSFINFGAFTAFAFVNLSVIAVNMRERRLNNIWRIGNNFVAPAIGAVASVWLLMNLDLPAKMLGCIWLAIGIAYLVYLTRFFRIPPPEESGNQ
jgi:putrescine importer